MAKGNILSLKFLFIPFVDSLSCFVLYLIKDWYRMAILLFGSFTRAQYCMGMVIYMNIIRNVIPINLCLYSTTEWNQLQLQYCYCLDNKCFTNVSLSFYIPWELRFNMANDCERNYSYHKLNCLYIPVVHVYGEH